MASGSFQLLRDEIRTAFRDTLKTMFAFIPTSFADAVAADTTILQGFVYLIAGLVFMFPLLIFALAMPETARGMSCSVDLSRAGNAARFVSLPNLANLAFLGLFASAACFVAWNKACERLGTVRCSLGLYLIPVIAFLIAHVFLGETLPAAGVAGAVLVLAGVAVAGASGRRHRQDAA